MKSSGLSAETAGYLAKLTGEPPRQQSLWLEALTHGSMGEQVHYQRLEFLGDRVLGLAIAEWLHESGNDSEGKLSQRLNALVSGSACAEIARHIGLPPHLRLGKQARDDGGHDSDNILGDVMESLIGALFIERGYEAARDLVRKLWADLVARGKGTSKHPKAALQEWAAGNKRKVPEYTLLSREGPDHAATFVVEVAIKGIGSARGSAASKQEAETQAAREFMERFG
ncbi:ribonuclease III [Novosphingobium tardum]|uniref:Ribonuclease 3 n=1 Tax=Novosphingobium tardum TaxID=1538021 RepID=A0ABV8RST5_9SPHN